VRRGEVDGTAGGLLEHRDRFPVARGSQGHAAWSPVSRAAYLALAELTQSALVTADMRLTIGIWRGGTAVEIAVMELGGALGGRRDRAD
jgi:hypothetical protein